MEGGVTVVMDYPRRTDYKGRVTRVARAVHVSVAQRAESRGGENKSIFSSSKSPTMVAFIDLIGQNYPGSGAITMFSGSCSCAGAA